MQAASSARVAVAQRTRASSRSQRCKMQRGKKCFAQSACRLGNRDAADAHGQSMGKFSRHSVARITQVQSHSAQVCSGLGAVEAAPSGIAGCFKCQSCGTPYSNGQEFSEVSDGKGKSVLCAKCAKSSGSKSAGSRGSVLDTKPASSQSASNQGSVTAAKPASSQPASNQGSATAAKPASSAPAKSSSATPSPGLPVRRLTETGFPTLQHAGAHMSNTCRTHILCMSVSMSKVFPTQLRCRLRRGTRIRSKVLRHRSVLCVHSQSPDKSSMSLTARTLNAIL